MRFTTEQLTKIKLFSLLILMSTSCKTTAPDNELSGKTVAKLQRQNPYWTVEARQNIVQQATCSAIAYLLLQKQDQTAKFDLDFLYQQEQKRIALGLATIQESRNNKTLLEKIWRTINPKNYLPNEDNYSYIELQKHLYSLFQSEDQQYLQDQYSNNLSQALQQLTIDDANRLRLTTSYLLEKFGAYQPLSLMELLVLLAPSTGYDPFKTVGLISWVNYRDVMIADGQYEYMDRAKGVIISRFTVPLLPQEDDPAGQSYHFWGYTSRRLGQGPLVGGKVAELMSFYWEQFKSEDDEDHFTDLAGIQFAETLIRVLKNYTPRTVATLRDIYESEKCYSYDRVNLQIVNRETPTSYCRIQPVISEQTAAAPSRPDLKLFAEVYSDDQSLSAASHCRYLAAMELNRSLWDGKRMRKPDQIQYSVIVKRETNERVSHSGQISLSELHKN